VKSSKTVALLTSNTAGGIVQFTCTFAKSLCDIGYDTHVFCPSGVQLNISAKCTVHSYEYLKSKDLVFGGRRKWAGLERDILAVNPALLIFTDNGRMCRKMMQILQGRVRTMVTIHDVNPHPTVLISAKGKVRQFCDNRLLPDGIDMADDVLLLSKHSMSQFMQLNKQYTDKVHCMPLGAHPVAAQAIEPNEITTSAPDYGGGFLLFFGRIDKYKGIERMLRAYRSACKEGSVLPLVIAGGGPLSDEETSLSQQPGVTVVNRFISDGEMVWLFEHATAVVLPYIEATQSGVLVMAYHYGKPVICSDLPGLAEFVEDGQTGILCPDEAVLSEAMTAMSIPGKAESMRPAIKQYEADHLDWEQNVAKLMRALL
jgi:glycosyltransferase involved in cell wall biosynthesis